MNSRMGAPDSPSSAPSNRFVVAGISLTSLRRQLKPALPKKRQEASYRVVISTTATSVTFAIPGAAVGMPALTTGPFTAELPYSYFKGVLASRYEDGAMVLFELKAGSLSINNVTTTAPGIIVQPSPGNSSGDQRAASASPPTVTDPSEAPLGLPLLAAYAYIRRYGLQLAITSQTFSSQQAEVNGLLDRAARYLRPVGITRSDLECVLDKKLGLG